MSKAREMAGCFPVPALQGTWRAGHCWWPLRKAAIGGCVSWMAKGAVVLTTALAILGGSDLESLRGKGKDRGSKNL